MSKVVSLVLAVLIVSGPVLVAVAAEGELKKDGHYYFEQLKGSIKEVIDGHQTLINSNSDGGKKSDELTANSFYRVAYKNFKKIVGAKFSPPLQPLPL